MNFRLPFQISRVSAICQSSSAVNLISKFTPIYRNHVKTLSKDKQNSTNYARIIRNKCRCRTIHSPFNIYQQNAFIHNIAETEQAVKQRVRNEQRCDCQIPEEPRLAFRQSTKIQCFPCIDHKPCVAPPLYRPEKLYDDTKCLYEHKCHPDLCNIKPPRKDDACQVLHERKKLPPLPATNICHCLDKKPLIAPPLCPPPRLYDPDKMKWEHEICEVSQCIRMDDACGFKVIQKELPTIPRNNCKPCLALRPMTAPTLIRPVLRYDPTGIPYPHVSCPPEIAPTRRDHFFCEPIYRDLPPMPCSNCMPCQHHVPTVCPLLKRLEARYDSCDMKYKHECPKTPCDTPSLRRDNNIISVTLTKKKLPRLNEDKTCKPCLNCRPLTAPQLGRPMRYNNSLTEEQARTHCIEEKCVRRDGVIKIWRKHLPPVPTSVCCQPCLDSFIPCTTPHFSAPKKLYDDSTCKYRHECIPERCDENPPRMDDIKCYKDEPRKLPKPPYSPDCKPCTEHPRTAPRLCRPHKCYDDSKHKYKHPICPEDPCIVTPRSDDITGMTDEAKCLQTYKPLKCKPCQQCVACRAPVLRRPHARYDDTCMLYDHKTCPPPCDGAVFRRDHYIWEEPRKLPKVKCGTICEQCQVTYPTTAPYLRRPQKLYEFPNDPVRIKECPPECPPRRDDLLCWKPKRKKLPSFKDCDQCCYYSTIAWTNKKHIKLPLNSKRNFEKKLFPKIKTDIKYSYSTKHVQNFTKLPEREKLIKSKNCNEQQQIGQTKPSQVQSEARYYVVKEPTWKCMDVTNVQTNKTKKKFDYSIERWLREGAEQTVKAASKPNARKRHTHTYDRFDIHSKYLGGSECITPVKFTGFDTSGCNEFLCIKKNNKLQPLRIGSAFRTDEYFQPSDNTACNKTQIKTDMCVSRDVNSNLNKNKTTTEYVPKASKKHHTYSTIIQERIKQHISPASNLPTSNFILRLNNKMRSTLFQKISNFFKHRENVAKHRKLMDAQNNRTGVFFERNKLKKELIANVCEKYDIELNLNKLKRDKNKPYIVQKFKNQKFQIKMDKSAMCCSKKLASNRDEPSKATSLPKNMKMKVDQIRNFSTTSKTGPLYYKHIDISDDYIGKIYKVKLKKIGVKNLMLEKNDPDKMDEEPHTICYICKVVPRYQPVFDDDPPDIENVKINYYKEKRNTID